jgi:hypothetical protein
MPMTSTGQMICFILYGSQHVRNFDTPTTTINPLDQLENLICAQLIKESFVFYEK